MGASIPASGSWLHGLQGSGDGATQHLSENANSEAVHSVDLGGKSSAWVRAFPLVVIPMATELALLLSCVDYITHRHCPTCDLLALKQQVMSSK